MTSNAVCASPTTAISPGIVMTVFTGHLLYQIILLMGPDAVCPAQLKHILSIQLQMRLITAGLYLQDG